MFQKEIYLTQTKKGAIAAFQENNKIRRYNWVKELDSMIIPCITMIGTFPMFYLVPITKDLNIAVLTGQYPAVWTVVLMFTPNIDGRRRSEGMVSDDNMKEILKCYSGFRDVAEECYTRFLV